MTETKIPPISGGVAKFHAPESPLRALEPRPPVLFQMGVPLKHGELNNASTEDGDRVCRCRIRCGICT